MVCVLGVMSAGCLFVQHGHSKWQKSERERPSNVEDVVYI